MVVHDALTPGNFLIGRLLVAVPDPFFVPEILSSSTMASVLSNGMTLLVDVVQSISQLYNYNV